MYKSLKLKNGDISFDSLGKLEFVEDNESIIQTINIRLNTLKGELFYNLDFGIEPITNFKSTEDNIAKLQSYFRDALVDGEKITSVFVNDIRRVGVGEYVIDLEISAINNSSIELDYSFEVNLDANGI